MKTRNPFYVERSCLGTRVLQLDGYWLTSSGGWGARKTKCQLDLRSASPNFESVRGRFYKMIMVVLIVTIIPIYILNYLRSRVPTGFGGDDFYKEFGFTEISAIWGIMCLWHLIRFLPAVHLIRIRSKSGKVVLDIIEDRKAPSDFSVFVQEVRSRIETNTVH